MDLAPEAAAKAIVYASLLLAIGANATRWLLAPRLESPPGNLITEFDHRLARICTGSAATLLAAHLLRALAHTASAFGWRDAFTWSQFSVVALESRWGSGWRIQAAAAVVLLAASSVIRFHRAAGWTLASLAAMACVVSMPLLGHAASNPYGLFLHSAHILGAGLWLGSLACILIAGNPVATGLLRYFSPIALTGAGLAIAAGGVAAIEYVGSWAQLWSTPYGRTLLLKLMVLAAVVCLGFRNWRRWTTLAPAAVTDRRSELAESVLALTIVLITSVLTELAHP